MTETTVPQNTIDVIEAPQQLALERLATEPIPRRVPAALGGRIRLVFLSLLMLFTELALIRWTTANNVNLSYITNFVLLASFLGVGAGFLMAKARLNLFSWLPIVLALLVGFVLAFPVKLVALADPAHPYQLQGSDGMAALPKLISLAVVFVLVVAVMTCVGQGVARSFGQFAPLEAYRLDIIGSIGGVVAFSLLSFLWLPPVAWGAIVAVVFVALCKGRLRLWQWVGVLGVVMLLAFESASPVSQWSPYDKVTAVHLPDDGGSLVVSANNIPHQTTYSLSTLHRIESFYFFPYRHVSRRSLNQVLVIGAGTGNDLAVALSEGAKHIDAVEIDPVLAQLGHSFHPNHPYQSPRVKLHINDGRAYLQQTHTKYDLVLFALPDSLTALAGQSSLRLENYLLTADSMREVKAHLNPGGVFSMYNYYEPFLLDRYASALVSVYANRPCVELGDKLNGRQQAVLTIPARGAVAQCSSTWIGRQVSVGTDDYPFPYLPKPTIPPLYLWTILCILGAAVIVVRVAGGPFRRMASYLDLAFMGAAFMLLETKSIVQFALLFGTTWFVNSLVFAGVLLAVFAAVEVARRVTLPRPSVLYAVLFAAIAVAWAVPQESLLSLSFFPRFLFATVIAFAPIFLANLVFSQRFKDVGSSTTAFGANLLGAMGGGCLEYLSLITGYRFLLVVVAVLYGLAFLANRRYMAAGGERRVLAVDSLAGAGAGAVHGAP